MSAHSWASARGGNATYVDWLDARAGYDEREDAKHEEPNPQDGMLVKYVELAARYREALRRVSRYEGTDETARNWIREALK